MTRQSWWSRLRLAIRILFSPGRRVPEPLEYEETDKPRERRPLVLRVSAITRRVDALFKAMSTDYLLREQFVTDPAQILTEYVEGRKLPPQQASVSNQLLYSVMSNPRLLRWLRDYGIERRNEPPSRQQFMLDFGNAVVKYGGEHVVLSLIRSSMEAEAVLGIGGGEQAFLITSSPLIASGVIVKTDQRTLNDSNSTQSFEHSTTNIGTGPGTFHGTEVTDPGTGTSTGTSTDTGTDSTGTDSTGTDSTGTDATGTDSTGTDSTGTDSTGTDDGTDDGTGTDTGTDDGSSEFDFGLDEFTSRYARITIEALVDYANELSRSGALNDVLEGGQRFGR